MSNKTFDKQLQHHTPSRMPNENRLSVTPNFFQTCPSGHVVWQWSSQSTLKYGMQIGDFMLAVNILLSGNNYAKVALLFQYMNMGMVGRSTFFKIQDTYCVDTIKQFWEEKRAAIVSRAQSKASVVVLGKFYDFPLNSILYSP